MQIQEMMKIVNMARPPLLSLPNEVLELILLRISDDVKSVLSLWEASKEVRMEIERTFNADLGRRKWALGCKNYHEDPLVMAVLASYCSVTDNSNSVSSMNEFLWFSVYQLAQSLPTIIGKSSPKLKVFQNLSSQIKIEMCLSMSMEKEGLHRHTGISGVMTWNILEGDSNTHTAVTLFKGSICQRMISLSCWGQVHQVLFMDLPKNDWKPCGNDTEVLNVWKLMIIVSTRSVLIIPVQNSIQGIRLPFRHYSFGKSISATYMNPIVRIHKHFVMIWSSPYDLKIYGIHISEFVPRVRAEHIMGLRNDDLLGQASLWEKMAKYKEIPYFVSFTAHQPVRCGDANGPFDSYKFDLMICSPRDFKREATVCNFNPNGVKFCFEKAKVIEHCYDADDLVLKELLDKTHLSSSAFGLYVAYSDEILVISNTGSRWFCRLWKDEPCMRDCVQSVIKVEVISSNMIVIVSNSVDEPRKSLISMVEISFAKAEKCTGGDEYPGEGVGHDEASEEMELILRKKINADFLPGHDGSKISQILFSYDQGVPYLWIEVKTLEDEEDNQTDENIREDLKFDFFRIDFVPNM